MTKAEIWARLNEAICVSSCMSSATAERFRSLARDIADDIAHEQANAAKDRDRIDELANTLLGLIADVGEIQRQLHIT